MTPPPIIYDIPIWAESCCDGTARRIYDDLMRRAATAYHAGNYRQCDQLRDDALAFVTRLWRAHKSRQPQPPTAAANRSRQPQPPTAHNPRKAVSSIAPDIDRRSPNREEKINHDLPTETLENH